MSYELTCPSCHARLFLRDGASEESLLCPRCLNMVPRPIGVNQASSSTAETSTITAFGSQSSQATPTVESETRRSIWSTYFVVLTVTVLAGLSLILAFIAATRNHVGSVEGIVFPLAFLCDAVLTVVILFPVVYAMFRGTRPGPATPRRVTVAKRIAVIALLVILGPVAAYIVFVAVCLASLVAVAPFAK